MRKSGAPAYRRSELQPVVSNFASGSFAPTGLSDVGDRVPRAYALGYSLPPLCGAWVSRSLALRVLVAVSAGSLALDTRRGFAGRGRECVRRASRVALRVSNAVDARWRYRVHPIFWGTHGWPRRSVAWLEAAIDDPSPGVELFVGPPVAVLELARRHAGGAKDSVRTRSLRALPV